MEVERGNLNDVKKLLKSGANVNGSSTLEMRPLISAARTGNATMLKLLISKGAKLEIEARNPHGARAVHAAISGERLDALCVLLEAGVDYDARDGDGQTPLMLTSLAITAGAMAEELLRVGADPSLKNHEGMSALHVAAGLNNTQVIGVILAKAPSLLNAVDDKGFTPMGTASLRGQLAAVEYLLAAGACDKDVAPERASIFWAAEGGRDNMVRVMLEHGNIDSLGGLRAIPDSMGVAIQGRKARMLQRLISVEGEGRRRAWAECVMRHRPAIHLAAVWVSLRALSVLLAAGAKEGAMDVQGECASDIIGVAMETFERDPHKEAALYRMLQRGPAFRARSWAWPAEVVAFGSAAKPTEEAAPVTPLRGPVRFCRPTRVARVFATRFAR